METRSICPAPGCNRITSGGRCEQHKKAGDAARPSRSKRGYTRRWYKHYQRPYIAQHPLCEDCKDKGNIQPAECVDHKTPHEGKPELLYCWENLRALCWSCHSRKTRRDQAKGS